MLKAYKYELRPTKEQKTSINKTIGACRLVYNLALETKTTSHSKGVTLTCYDLCKQLTDLKQGEKWLYEIPNHALQHSIHNLDSAYKNFFKGRSSFPSFKKKKSYGSYRIPEKIRIDFDNSLVFIPKLKWVSYNTTRRFDGKIRHATISRTATDRYYISIVVDTTDKHLDLKPITENTTVGIDLGIKHFATLSSGVKIDNPKNTLKFAKTLRREQRALSRKKVGSKRWHRQAKRVAKVHEKIKFKRLDFQHKLSTEITNQYDTICLENLNILGMVKNKSLSKHILDAGWGEFVRQLEYKSKWKGKNIIRIGRFEPSSKMCLCGKINSKLTLKMRVWQCQYCNKIHDRDVLAAKNIKNFGLRIKPDIR